MDNPIRFEDEYPEAAAFLVFSYSIPPQFTYLYRGRILPTRFIGGPIHIYDKNKKMRSMRGTSERRV